MTLRNRVALITGGTRGIGRGIALRLAKEGARVAIGYRANKNVAQNTLRQLQAAGADCVAVEADITTEERSEQFVNTVNVVNPSRIDEKELSLDEARRIKDARFPIGRPPTVDDVAAAVAFFASEEAEYVTGQVVNVSGGWML